MGYLWINGSNSDKKVQCIFFEGNFLDNSFNIVSSCCKIIWINSCKCSKNILLDLIINFDKLEIDLKILRLILFNQMLILLKNEHVNLESIFSDYIYFNF